MGIDKSELSGEDNSDFVIDVAARQKELVGQALDSEGRAVRGGVMVEGGEYAGETFKGAADLQNERIDYAADIAMSKDPSLKRADAISEAVAKFGTDGWSDSELRRTTQVAAEEELASLEK